MKLFKLKRWLTLGEAADHLSAVLNETVTVADILRLALDRHLTISINIVNGISCCKGNRIPFDRTPLVVTHSITAPGDSKERHAIEGYPDDSDPDGQRLWCVINVDRFKSGELIAFPRGVASTRDHSYFFDKKISSISGLWDLPMLGSEILDVEHQLQQLIEGPEVTGIYLDGTFLVSLDGNEYVHVMEHFSENEFCKDGNDRTKYPWGKYESYYPAGRLPPDENFVIRTDVLSEFIRSLQEGDAAEERQIKTREKVGLLRIIAALAKEAGIDITEGKGGAVAIEAAIAAAGFDGPRERTIREILKQAREVE